MNYKVAFFTILWTIFFVLLSLFYIIGPEEIYNDLLYKRYDGKVKYSNKKGDNLTLVFIGSSTCDASNKSRLVEVVREAKNHFHGYTQGSDTSFSSIGVAMDINANIGTKYLKKFGNFTQVISGGRAYNMGAMKYLWKKIPGEAATPQILILNRSLVDSPKNIRVDSVFTRKVGLSSIYIWRSEDFPLH